MNGDLDFRWLGRVSYDAGLRLQEALVAKRRVGEIADTVLLLEHEPVYTIGRTPDKSSLAGATAMLPHPVVEISRGGQATYHGPGQLVGYLILDLANYGRDLHTYLRAIESALIAGCAGAGISAHRREGLTGVWVGEKKAASIGVGVRRWISMHGFAINVTAESLGGFQCIVPCGLAGVEMTCIEIESGRPQSVESFAIAMKSPLTAALGCLRRAG